MKKIVIFLCLFFVTFAFAQKTVYILNNSTKTVYLINLKTKPLTGTYPYYIATGFNTANNIIGPGKILILENVSNLLKFPFSFNTSQVSDLFVNSWRFYLNSSSLGTNTSNVTCYNSPNSTNQIFDRVSIRVGVGGSLGVGTLGLNYPSTVQGNGWYADYALSTDPNFPNLQETIITINDL